MQLPTFTPPTGRAPTYRQPQQGFGRVVNNFPRFIEVEQEKTPQGTTSTIYGTHINHHTSHVLVGTVYEPTGTYDAQMIILTLGKEGTFADHVAMTILPTTGTQDAAFMGRATSATLPNDTHLHTLGTSFNEALAQQGRELLASMASYTPPTHVSNRPIEVANIPVGGDSSRTKPVHKLISPYNADGTVPISTFVKGLKQLGAQSIIVSTSPNIDSLVEPLLKGTPESKTVSGDKMGDTKQGLLSAAAAMEANPDGLYLQVFPDAAVDIKALVEQGTQKIEEGADAVILATPVTGDDRKNYGILQLNDEGFVTAITEQATDVLHLPDPALANTGGLLLSYKAFMHGLKYMQSLPEGHPADAGSAAKGWWQKTKFLKGFKVAVVESPFVDFGNEGGNGLLQLHTPGITAVKGAEHGMLTNTQVNPTGRFVVMPHNTVEASLHTYGLA